MITEQELAVARRRAFELMQRSGFPVRPEEAERIEVADFGLSNLETEGGQILTLVQGERIGVKLIALFAGQTLPEHWHPPMGDDPGKEETVRVVWGILRFYDEGPDTVHDGSVPAGKDGVYTMRHETVMRPGDQMFCAPGSKHWFQAGPEGAVVFSFSSVARDVLDRFSDPAVTRTTVVKERHGG